MLKRLALVAILGLCGCAGFGAGIKKGVTGEQPTAEEQTEPGFPWGKLVGGAIGTALTIGLPILLHGKMTAPDQPKV